MTDYSDARYWAISGIGYGKGFTPEEAKANYAKTQLRNHGPQVRDLLENEAAPVVYLAPEGSDGFVHSWDGLTWTAGDDDVRKAEADDVIENPHWKDET